MAVTRVVMPKLSEAMESGRVIKWLKKEGDPIQGGDILAEIETDKADVEMEAFGAGVLRKILVPNGERAPVGGLIAVIADPDEDVTALVAAAPPAGTAGTASVVAPGEGAGRPSARPASATGPVPMPMPTGSDERRVKASPLARKIAAQSGVDLRVVHGSGPGGRIIRRDVEAAAGGAEAAAGGLPAAPARVSPAGRPEYEDRPLTQIRAAIARRMPQSKAPVPHFYVTSEVAMERAWELREALNALEGQPRVSLNDLVVRACALALLRHPGVNASFQGDTIRVWHRAHIGIAVALDEGLITPVLRDCDAKSVVQIAGEARDLAERARARKLRASEVGGATFSISNLGMLDVAEFSAIINPPEGAILAVGAVRRVPVVDGDAVTIGRRMAMTLSCDHRVMDGAMGARFLQDVRRLLEEPLRLLL